MFQTAPASPLLVWVANGAAPGKQTASEPGTAYINSSGVAETVLELPKETYALNRAVIRLHHPMGSFMRFM